jgi:hypothetical protein
VKPKEYVADVEFTAKTGIWYGNDHSCIFFFKKNKGNVTANPLKDENFSMGFN